MSIANSLKFFIGNSSQLPGELFAMVFSLYQWELRYRPIRSLSNTKSRPRDWVAKIRTEGTSFYSPLFKRLSNVVCKERIMWKTNTTSLNHEL